LHINFVSFFIMILNRTRNQKSENCAQPKGAGTGTKTQSEKQGENEQQFVKFQFGRSQAT